MSSKKYTYVEESKKICNNRQISIEQSFPKKIFDDPPKVFWKYYDLYRRNKISIAQYVEKTGITEYAIRIFLNQIGENKAKKIEYFEQI